MIKFRHKGDFKKTERYLKGLQHKDIYAGLEELGQMGVDALASATPVRTGVTASSWTYKVIKDKERVGIYWENENINNGVNIAILLQYGHGTGTGAYVQGKDYINPAIQPVFDMIAEKVWREVTSE